MKLPSSLALRYTQKGDEIRQIESPGCEIEGVFAKWTGDAGTGLVFIPEDKAIPHVHVLEKKPKGNVDGMRIIVRPLDEVPVSDLDLSHEEWLDSGESSIDSILAHRVPIKAVASWRGAFSYVQEDEMQEIVGLRPPQIGALHAIMAHWSVDAGVATVVMPTGTGKTDTMIAATVAAACERVLVVVPTDALRTQLAEKFLNLGVLRADRAKLLLDSASYPVVGTLKHTPATVDEAERFFSACNVVVITSGIAARCEAAVRERISELCPYLFIDEAHHAEAPTWKTFKKSFKSGKVLQFTATPFREDDKLVDGRIIYRYPLRKAQAENYFKPIAFSSVLEFDQTKADAAIAAKAIEELHRDTTGKHILMARVANIHRAADVFKLYEPHTEYGPVLLHSKLTAKEREESKQALISGRSRIVVCVDMLGEGFDLPELKIAAFHDIRKTLAVTLQLAGRFTRSRSDLGNATFIANTGIVEVRDELRKLYSRDPDWNVLLPPLSDGAIDEQVATQEFVDGFSEFPSEFPLREIRPAASTVIYRTRCGAWNPHAFEEGLRGASSFDQLHISVNEQKRMLVAIVGRSSQTEWADLEDIRDWNWEMFVMYWSEEQALLYVHGSGNHGEFQGIAHKVGGDDAELVSGAQLFRCFHGIARLMFTNVGLTEHLGRLVRYTGRMGPDVGQRLTDAQKQNTQKSVLFGAGYSGGEKATIGVSRKGRVWSFRRLRLDSFAAWCDAVGAKVLDTKIDPDEVLKGTLEPVMISTRPEIMPIAIDWPTHLYHDLEQGYSLRFGEAEPVPFYFVGIELENPSTKGDLTFRIFTEEAATVLRLELFGSEDTSNFRVVHVSGDRLSFCTARASASAEAFLTKASPLIWFVDGSSLEGNQHVSPKAKHIPYNKSKIVAWDWIGIDLTREAQGTSRLPNSIQRRVIENVLLDPSYSVVFDDDGAGESADVVAIRQVERDGAKEIDVVFYHCKFSKEKPGARVDDLFVVCGQAQKSISWLFSQDKRTDLFRHLLKREPKRKSGVEVTRFERGGVTELMTFVEMSRLCRVSLHIYVVQPGMSKAQASTAQLDLLAATEHYLMETCQVPFGVIGSQ
nr:DEAD/DEAH box helicase family protein [Duganella sp. 1224]